MRFLVLFFACVIAAIGLAGIIAPAQFLVAMRAVITPAGLYGIGALRVAMGLVLVWAAASSRAPTALRAAGVVLVVAGLATPWFGVDRTLAVMDYASAHGARLLRGGGVVLLACGAFIAFAASPRHQG